MGPLKALIDQFVREGVLISYISCTRASSLVIVHKKEGEIRMAVDYREFNQYLRVSTRYVVPTARRPAIFAKVDSLWGYHINYDWIRKVVVLQQSLHHGVSFGSWHAPLEFQHRENIKPEWLTKYWKVFI